MGYKLDSLRLQPGFSRYLAYWLVALHMFALLVLWQLHWNLPVKLILSLLIFLYFIWQFRCHLLRSTRNAIRELLLESDGDWWLISNDGIKLRAELSSESFVKPWLMVLNFQTGSWYSNRSLILPPDSLNAELARRLRIHLQQTSSRQQGIDPQSGSTGSKGE